MSAATREWVLLGTAVAGIVSLLGATPVPRKPSPLPKVLRCWHAQVRVKGGAELGALYTTRPDCERFLRLMYEAQCHTYTGVAREQCLAEVARASTCTPVDCTAWPSDEWTDPEDADDDRTS